MFRMNMFLLSIVLGVICVQTEYADENEVLDVVLDKRSTCVRASGNCKYFRQACDPGYDECVNKTYSCPRDRDKCCCRSSKTNSTTTTDCGQASGICKYFRLACDPGYDNCVDNKYSCPMERDRCCCPYNKTIASMATNTAITTDCEQASGICKYFRHACGPGYHKCVNTLTRRYSCPGYRDKCCCRKKKIAKPTNSTNIMTT